MATVRVSAGMLRSTWLDGSDWMLIGTSFNIRVLDRQVV